MVLIISIIFFSSFSLSFTRTCQHPCPGRAAPTRSCSPHQYIKARTTRLQQASVKHDTPLSNYLLSIPLLIWKMIPFHILWSSYYTTDKMHNRGVDKRQTIWEAKIETRKKTMTQTIATPIIHHMYTPKSPPLVKNQSATNKYPITS